MNQLIILILAIFSFSALSLKTNNQTSFLHKKSKLCDPIVALASYYTPQTGWTSFDKYPRSMYNNNFIFI